MGRVFFVFPQGKHEHYRLEMLEVDSLDISPREVGVSPRVGKLSVSPPF